MNNGNIGGVGDGPSPDEWFRSLPFVTRFWFGGSIVCTLGGNFGLVNPMKMIFLWAPIKDNFEVWRLLTCFCYIGEFSINTLFTFYMLYQFSLQYEKGGPYNTGAGGGSADYLTCLLFGMTAMLLSYPFLVGIISPVMTRSLVFYVLYVWSKKFPYVQANIWGVPIKAVYLPFAYCGLTVLLGNSPNEILFGIAAGHAYYFLVDVVPLMYGKDLLHTPQFFIDYFGVGAYVPPVQAAPVVPVNRGFTATPGRIHAPGRVNAPSDPAGGAPRAAPGAGHQWGAGGRALGSS